MTPDTEELVCVECKESEMIRAGSVHQIKATNCRVKPSDPVFLDTTTPDTEWRANYNEFVKDVREYGDFPEVLASHVEKFIEHVITSRDTYWKERVEELELSCIDDRLLGKTDEYLDGYNTSTQRWREQRDNLLQELDNLK